MAVIADQNTRLPMCIPIPPPPETRWLQDVSQAGLGRNGRESGARNRQSNLM
jgi:hypothetical protein